MWPPCAGELERPPKDDCQLQREANPPTFILAGAGTPLDAGHTLSHMYMPFITAVFCASSNLSTGDTVTFSGAKPPQKNMSLHCSATNCSLQPGTNNSRPTQLSVHTVNTVTYRSRIHSGRLVVLSSNGSWLDCSGLTCTLTDCPEGERRVEGRFCVQHLLTIHFKDPEIEDGEHEGLQSGAEVSLTPAFKGTPRTCSNCPAKTDKRGLKSLIINKWDS